MNRLEEVLDEEKEDTVLPALMTRELGYLIVHPRKGGGHHCLEKIGHIDKQWQFKEGCGISWDMYLGKYTGISKIRYGVFRLDDKVIIAENVAKGDDIETLIDEAKIIDYYNWKKLELAGKKTPQLFHNFLKCLRPLDAKTARKFKQVWKYGDLEWWKGGMNGNELREIELLPQRKEIFDQLPRVGTGLQTFRNC